MGATDSHPRFFPPRDTPPPSTRGVREAFERFARHFTNHHSSRKSEINTRNNDVGPWLVFLLARNPRRVLLAREGEGVENVKRASRGGGPKGVEGGRREAKEMANGRHERYEKCLFTSERLRYENT